MTKADKIRRFIKKGLSAAEIVKKLKCSPGSVYRLMEVKKSKPIKFYSPPMTTEQAIERVKANEVQVGGAHYKALTPQPWDVINAWGLGFLDGNVVKYVARFRNKGGVEDLRKAKHYLDKLIEVEEKK